MLATVPLVWLLAATPADAARRKPAPEPDLAAVAADLLGRGLTQTEAYDELRELCDTIGHRLSGTPALQKAVAWAAAEMAEDGLSVTTEPVEVPVWVRGDEAGRIVSPVADALNVLALGDSVATDPDGLEADVLVVSTFEELDARGAEAKGRIVVFDAPFTSYGETVGYRWAGASAAARHGAVGALVRSVSPVSLYTPHTGNQGYADDVLPIPVAAIPIEDAERLHRVQDAGTTPRVWFELDAKRTGTATSHNVVGELRGRSTPDEVVVLGCHLDSWDVGQGAQDDGAGCVTVMEAVAQLAALPVRPRRTVRAVLYTNEENGLSGGKTYATVHAGERIVAAIEDDTGSGAPLGFGVDVRVDGDKDDAASAAVAERLAPHLALLAPTGATDVGPGFSGADIGPLVAGGTVGFGLRHDMTGYWPVHHTEADTFDKVDPTLVQRNVAAMTVMAWILAEAPGDLRETK